MRRWIGETPQPTDVRLLLETLVVWLGCCCRPYAALHCCWWERRGIPILHQAGSEEEWSTRIWRKTHWRIIHQNPDRESWPTNHAIGTSHTPFQPTERRERKDPQPDVDGDLERTERDFDHLQFLQIQKHRKKKARRERERESVFEKGFLGSSTKTMAATTTTASPLLLQSSSWATACKRSTHHGMYVCASSSSSSSITFANTLEQCRCSSCCSPSAREMNGDY